MTPWTVAHQAPLSLGFARQEYWSKLSSPSPGDLPNPRIKTASLPSPALQLSHRKSPTSSLPPSKSHESLSHSVQFSSVTQSCQTLCNPMKCSMPGLPVHHQLLEFTQTHGHQVRDAIQPSHPLSSPSAPAPNPSQHQSLFQ